MPTTHRKVALVAGVHGVIGGNLARHLVGLGDWDVIGLSRRGDAGTDDTPGAIRHVAVDLLDPDDTRAKVGGLTEVTHVFYAAYQDRPTWAELVEPNVAMFRNVLDAVEAAAPGLEHVDLMQGYKVYGAHLGPFKTPAREDDARHMPPEFNVDQQDLLEERQRGRSWTWSALRPSVVGGYAVGNPMNLALVIAVYASVSARLGLPLRFPGRPGAYDALLEVTDAGLLAKAAVWAATDARAANQAFNISNGDQFRWSEMWPLLADHFGLDVAPPLPMSLAEVMADKAQLWKEIQAEHDLEPHAYDALVSWPFGDGVFSWDYDMLADGSKARRFGFHEHVDTRRMFGDLFTALRERRLIP